MSKQVEIFATANRLCARLRRLPDLC